MSYILSYLIILTVKTVKWLIIKSRLYIAALPISIIVLFFNDWYMSNIITVYLIGAALLLCIVVSWSITILKYIKDKKLNSMKTMNYAYAKYGEPILLKKKEY